MVRRPGDDPAAALFAVLCGHYGTGIRGYVECRPAPGTITDRIIFVIRSVNVSHRQSVVVHKCRSKLVGVTGITPASSKCP
ncbi:hypothetical protein GCM10009828_081790 [Actinoplanes couchii]|uniref:Secreted protein n=1 Tax=Actinoplanes couchii TaxID=403638 RepID=A0ABQ3XL12_9ACTN|nr:hypothetical protein Aco03nite_075960 [Actinoplanes couchii]